jgi:ABC-type glycerol-3-phosphate transport system permease component
VSPRLSPIQKVATYGLLGLLALTVLFPIYYMILISLKLPRDIYRTPSLWPLGATLKNYVDLVTTQGFLINIGNSLIVAGVATIVSVFISCLAAYSLVRLKYRYRTWLGRLILFS